MKKPEYCAYCQKRRKNYRCKGMLSPHCKECCPFNCRNRKISLLDESFKWARDMGSASWPSADCTRMAMSHLVAGIASHFQKIAKKPMSTKEISQEILRACGLLKPKKSHSLSDLVKKAEAII